MDAVVFGYYYYEPCLPPISCTTVWPILQHLPNHAVVKEDVPVCHQVDHDMIITDTAELGEVNDGDNIVLQDSLHHLERVSTPGPYVHHMASVMCSAQTSITTPTSGSHSSYTTPLPWIMPPPTAITMIPGSRSSCHPNDEQNCDGRPFNNLGEQFAACTESGVDNNFTAALTSRATSPNTDESAGNQQVGAKSS